MKRMTTKTTSLNTTTVPAMHGDLVACFTTLLFIVLWVQPALNKLPAGDSRLPVAYAVTLSYCSNAVFGFCSWRTGKSYFSVMAAVGHIAVMVMQPLFRFPEMEGTTVTSHFLFILLMFSCNVKLQLHYKFSLGFLALAAVLWTAVYSPTRTFSSEEQFQIVASSVRGAVVYMTFHICCWAFDNTENLAQACLALAFVYNMTREIYKMSQDPQYGPEGGTAIVETAALAVFGLFALGTFRIEKQTASRLKARVEEQEDKLHMVGLALKVSDTAVAITTSCRDIIWSNPAFERLFDLQRNQQLPSDGEGAVVKLDHLNSAGKLVELFDDSNKSKKTAEISVGDSILQVEISPFYSNRIGDDKLESISSSHQDDSGELRFLVVLKDVTAEFARKKAEKAAQQEALLTKAMSESMETLTHELRTPLVGVRGITSMLVHEEGLPSDVKESLDLIMASSGLLLVLINNLLDIRKLHANMMEDFPLDPISLTGPLKDAVGFCRPLAVISGVSINVVVDNQSQDGGDAFVLSNDLRLQQVIINLISNAIKYTPSGGTIEIYHSVRTVREVERCLNTALATGERKAVDETTQKEDERLLVVSVADTGSGIAPGQENKLFQKFAMLNNKWKGSLGKDMVGQPTGTGLGLNLCQKFVQLMNGNIWAINNPNGGATFSFSLPLENSACPSKRPDGVAKKPTAVARRSSSVFKHRVLLVDDTLINRKVLARMLKQIGVSEMLTVASGPAALDALEKEEYDLVISDIQMPGMSGIELSRAIQTSTSLRKQPVVVGLTADTSQRTEDGCLECGMVGVLHKPITVDELSLYFDTVVWQLLHSDGD